jgi:hypothetical protein
MQTNKGNILMVGKFTREANAIICLLERLGYRVAWSKESGKIQSLKKKFI